MAKVTRLNCRPEWTVQQRLDHLSIPEPNSGCLLWMGSYGPHGYGIIGYGGRTWPAHRLAWANVNGPIPLGMMVCHRCDVRGCINPDHLTRSPPTPAPPGATTWSTCMRNDEKSSSLMKPLRALHGERRVRPGRRRLSTIASTGTGLTDFRNCVIVIFHPRAATRCARRPGPCSKRRRGIAGSWKSTPIGS